MLSELQNCASALPDEVKTRFYARFRPIANELRERGALDEEECFIDATFAIAKGGGAKIGATKRGC